MTIYRYAIQYGLSGCYMPDSTSGPYIGHTRRELMGLIRDTLKDYDMPVSLARDLHIKRRWPLIKRYGTSVHHISITHKGNELHFQGLTRDEATQLAREQD